MDNIYIIHKIALYVKDPIILKIFFHHNEYRQFIKSFDTGFDDLVNVYYRNQKKRYSTQDRHNYRLFKSMYRLNINFPNDYYNYKDAILEIKLPKEWKLLFTFHDSEKCDTMNLIQLIDPENNLTDSVYDPDFCVFGPPFFLLNEALWIIEAVYTNPNSECTIPQIYALLLPITVNELNYEKTRIMIEQKYKCNLDGLIWNRVSFCPLIYYYDDFNREDLEINWDDEYPVTLIETIYPFLPELIIGPFDIPMFPYTKEMHYSYRQINSYWMNKNASVLSRFLSIME